MPRLVTVVFSLITNVCIHWCKDIPVIENNVSFFDSLFVYKLREYTLAQSFFPAALQHVL